MVQMLDPVCGIDLTTNENRGNYACKYEEQQYYFCSMNCLYEFTDDPGGYVAPEDLDEDVPENDEEDDLEQNEEAPV